MAKAMGLFLPSNPSFYPTPTPTQTQTHFCYPAKTLNPNRNSKNNAFFKTYSIPPRRGRGTESESESESEWCPVPLDQQPIIEYQNLSTSFPFSWASADLVEYFSRLMATGVSFGLFVGLPVSAFGAHSDPVNLVLGSVSTALFVVTMAVLRMYLGWAYVGNRLLSATVEYEETGWYDGQIWVKSAEVLARDRLLGSFQVKPVLSRLKNSLVALAISLFICVAFLINHEGSQKELRNLSYEARDRVVPGVYNDDSARSFEPDAFHNVPDLAPE